MQRASQMRPSIGGQAVIEGVMMRRLDKFAIAVRRPDGSIWVKSFSFSSLLAEPGGARLAGLRGVVNLLESLMIGVKAIAISASEAMGAEVKVTRKDITFAMILALVVAVVLFFVLPTLVVRFLDPYVSSAYLVNLIEGLVRLIIFIGYLGGISLVKDVRRVFQYHGAEHKVVNSYELGNDPNSDDLEKRSCLHVRCGTNFLLVVIVVSILLFSFFGRPSLPIRVLTRVAIIPVVAAISYEVIKLLSKHDRSRLVRAIIYPGLLLQKLTTKEPSRDQIEVALAAFNAVMMDGTA